MRNQVPERPVLGHWRREAPVANAGIYTLPNNGNMTIPTVGTAVSKTVTLAETSHVRVIAQCAFSLLYATAASTFNPAIKVTKDGVDHATNALQDTSIYSPATGTTYASLMWIGEWADLAAGDHVFAMQVAEWSQVAKTRKSFNHELHFDVCRA